MSDKKPEARLYRFEPRKYLKTYTEVIDVGKVKNDFGEGKYAIEIVSEEGKVVKMMSFVIPDYLELNGNPI